MDTGSYAIFFTLFHTIRSIDMTLCSNFKRIYVNVFSDPYQLDESISKFRVVGWYFSFLYKF